MTTCKPRLNTVVISVLTLSRLAARTANPSEAQITSCVMHLLHQPEQVLYPADESQRHFPIKQTYSGNTRVLHSTRCDQPSRSVGADIPVAGLVTAEVNG